MADRLMTAREASRLLSASFSDDELTELIDFLKRWSRRNFADSHLYLCWLKRRSAEQVRQCLCDYSNDTVLESLHRLLFKDAALRRVLFTDGLKGDYMPVIKETPTIKKMVREKPVPVPALPVLVTRPPVIKEESKQKDPGPSSRKSRAEAMWKWKEERKKALKKSASAPLPFSGPFTIAKDGLGAVVVTEHAWIRFFKRYSAITRLKNPGWYAPEHFIRKMNDVFGRAREQRLTIEGETKRLIDNDFVPVRYFRDEILNLRFVVTAGSLVLVTVEIAYRH